jgi:hypothetical protein
MSFSTTQDHLNFTINFTFGAEDGSRTRNLQLGRLELYQLSYFRFWYPKFYLGTQNAFKEVAFAIGNQVG